MPCLLAAWSQQKEPEQCTSQKATANTFFELVHMNKCQSNPLNRRCHGKKSPQNTIRMYSEWMFYCLLFRWRQPSIGYCADQFSSLLYLISMKVVKEKKKSTQRKDTATAVSRCSRKMVDHRIIIQAPQLFIALFIAKQRTLMWEKLKTIT